MAQRIFRVLLHVLFWPLLLIILVAVAIYIPPVQNLIRNKAITFLKEKTGTEVRLGHFALRFPIGVSLEGLYVEGQDGDTLLYAGEVKARLGHTALARKKILLGGVQLSDVRATVIQRADSVFNFQFIINGFASTDTVTVAPKDKSGGWAFAFEDVLLKNIVFDLDLQPSDLKLDLHLGELSVDMDELDLDHQRYYVDRLQLSDTRVTMRTQSSPPEPNPYPALTNPLDSLDIRFQELGLKNVSFTMKTTNTGDSLWLKAGDVKVIADVMDLTKQKISLDELALTGSSFGMLTAHPDTTEKPKTDPPWLDQNDGFRFFIRDWDVKARTVVIAESVFAMHSVAVSDAKKLLDPEHLVVKQIDLELNDLTVNNEMVAGKFDSLYAVTGPNDTPLMATLQLEATPARFAINNGSIGAAGNSVQFNATADLGELARLYRDPQTIPLALKASTEIDVARLVALLRAMDMKVPAGLSTDEVLATNINIRGTMKTLDTLALLLEGDQGSVVRLNGRIANASDWPRSTFAVDVEKITMGVGMRQALQLFTPQGTVLPQRFTLQADATGNNGSMRANINMDSDLGAVSGNVGVDDWRDSIPEAFDIDLDVDRFRVSAFTKDTAIGPISLHIAGSGKQINSPNRTAHIEVLPKKLRYQGNDLSSLKITADALGDSIHANITAQAEPINIDLNAHGTWPNKGDSLTARFELALNTLELKALGLMDRTLKFNGNLKGRAAFDPDGHGSFQLNADGLRMANDERDFQFEQFLAKGSLNIDSTAFEINSDAITLLYHTNFPIDSLLPRTQEKLTSLFTADTAFMATAGKRMDLAITLPRSEWLTGLLVPELQAIKLENFTGSYDSDADVIDLNIDLPFLSYDSIRVENLITTIKAERSVLNGDITIAHIQRDSLFVDGLEVNARTGAGALTTTLRVMPVDSTEQYRLGVVLRNVENIRTLHMQENLVLNHVKWFADSTNILHFEPDGMRAENFILRSEEQSVELRTEPDALHILLAKFKLGTLTNLVSTMDSVPLATGILDGDVALPRGTNGMLKADLSINDLTTLGTPIGTLHITADQRSTSTYDATAALTNSSNKLDANATITTGGKTNIQAAADIDLGDISFLKPFVSSFLYALDGGIKGKLKYQQQGERTVMEGALDFNNAAVGVIMTGSTYTLKNERLVLNAQSAALKDLTLTDSLGNAFELNGTIELKNMANPKLDLTIKTDKFQLINSTYDQNQMFYGDLFASTDLRLTGAAKNPFLKGTVGILSGTKFSVVLPGSKVELVQAEGIVVFTDNLNAYDTAAVNTDGKVLRDSLMANLPGVELDLHVLIENGAQFAVVLDPTTGDQATVSGNGDLTFRYSPKGDIYLKGPFTIDEGGYTLEFYGLVKKRFDLVKGSSVRWNGDPLDAVMEIKARYTSDSAPYPLVASSSSGIADVERNRLQQPLPFEVVISVDGAINDPKIDFGIDLSRDLRNSYPKVSDRLEHLAQTGNTEERNRQVFGLLVLNSFIQDEASGGAPSSGIASSAARNSVNGLLTDQLNKLSGKFIKGVNIQLGVNTYDQASGNQTYQRTSVDYKVSKSILNDRLSFEVGGSVGVNETNSQVSNVSNTRAAQYAILYDLTKDGRFRIRGFHENAYDLYDGEITNSGVALMFTKEFEENERGRMRDREMIKRAEP